MTPAVDFIRRSFNAMAPRGVELVSRFYDRLYTHYPEVRPVFRNDNRLQLLNSLEYLINHLEDEPALIAYLSALSERHRHDEVDPQIYEKVVQALLGMLDDHACEIWSKDVRDAWIGACDYIQLLLAEKVSCVA